VLRFRSIICVTKLTDPGFISDLTNFNYVERILNDNEIQGKYSNEVGAHIERIIQTQLEQYQANASALVLSLT
jgi:hypothetical protein